MNEQIPLKYIKKRSLPSFLLLIPTCVLWTVRRDARDISLFRGRGLQFTYKSNKYLNYIGIPF